MAVKADGDFGSGSPSWRKEKVHSKERRFKREDYDGSSSIWPDTER